MVAMKELIDLRRELDAAVETHKEAFKRDVAVMTTEERVANDIYLHNLWRITMEAHAAYVNAFNTFMAEGPSDAARKAS